MGAAVRDCGIPRADLLVTSKLPGRHQAYKEALYTVEESLFRAGLDYYDLYLIHWPNPREDLYVEAWQALIEAKKRGMVRSIGVCNFLPEHLDRLMKETGTAPVINQVELHPYFNQETQRAFDKEHHIATEAWSPLGRASQMMNDPVITEIAEAHGKTVTQTILRWHVQLGVLPIPKAASDEHQKENLDLFNFALSEEEMKKSTVSPGKTAAHSIRIRLYTKNFKQLNEKNRASLHLRDTLFFYFLWLQTPVPVPSIIRLNTS